jgi:hypothetical protein
MSHSKKQLEWYGKMQLSAFLVNGSCTCLLCYLSLLKSSSDAWGVNIINYVFPP